MIFDEEEKDEIVEDSEKEEKDELLEQCVKEVKGDFLIFIQWLSFSLDKI